MTAKRGLGFMAWQLRSLPSPTEVLGFMNYYGAKWISIKMIDSSGVDGPFPYNWRKGDTGAIRDFIQTLANGGKTVGFWIYTSGYKPGPDGSMISEVVEKFEGDGISFVDLDAESGVWNKYGSKGKMETLLNSTFVPKRIPVYLNSYRFTTNFPQFPFAPALRHAKINGFNSPQVYWEFSHNPTSQLNRSYAEYKALTAPFEDFVPVAPAYWRGTPGKDGSWAPTMEDLRAFKVRVNELQLPGYGVYSFDKVWQHYHATTYTSGADWMEALTGKPKISDTPPPPPPIDDDTVRVAEVVINRLNQRTAPVVSSTTYGGFVSKGQRPYVHGALIQTADKRIWGRIGAERMYACFVDYNGTPLMKWVD